MILMVTWKSANYRHSSLKMGLYRLSFCHSSSSSGRDCTELCVTKWVVKSLNLIVANISRFTVFIGQSMSTKRSVTFYKSLPSLTQHKRTLPNITER